MAWEMERTSTKITRTAKADLRTKQYYFVKLVTDLDEDGNGEVDVCAAATDIPIGVLQNKPNVGEEAEITVIGVTKVSQNADLTNGNQIGTSNDGQAAPYANGTDTTSYIVGQLLLDGGGADTIGTAVIDCAAPHRGA